MSTADSCCSAGEASPFITVPGVTDAMLLVFLFPMNRSTCSGELPELLWSLLVRCQKQTTEIPLGHWRWSLHGGRGRPPPTQWAGFLHWEPLAHVTRCQSPSGELVITSLCFFQWELGHVLVAEAVVVFKMHLSREPTSVELGASSRWRSLRC